MFSQKNIKRLIILTVSVILMCLCVLALVLYNEGYYDLSFIKREEGHRAPSQTLPPHSSGEVSGEDETTSGGEVPSEDKFVIGMLDKGISGENYSDDMVIGKLDMSLPKEKYADKKTSIKQTVSLDGVLRIFDTEEVTEDRASVEQYMGYTVVCVDGKLDIYSGMTKVISGYDGDEPVFVYELSEDGSPVFRVGEDYCTIKDGGFASCEYEKLGFLYNRGEIDTSKKASFRKYKVSEVKDMPGAVYFSDGACMVRYIEYNTRDKVSTDIEVIVDSDGNELYLPPSSSVKAYSQGRVLITINGKYGFYATKNAWVAECEYTYATPYSEGLAVLGREDGSKCVIDLDGAVVIPFGIYTEISQCVNGTMVCYSEQGGYEVLGKGLK